MTMRFDTSNVLDKKVYEIIAALEGFNTNYGGIYLISKIWSFFTTIGDYCEHHVIMQCEHEAYLYKLIDLIDRSIKKAITNDKLYPEIEDILCSIKNICKVQVGIINGLNSMEQENNRQVFDQLDDLISPLDYIEIYGENTEEDK